MSHDIYFGEYFYWLISLVDNSRGDLAKSYSKMLDCMHRTTYIPMHKMDSSRIVDAQYMRRDFYGDLGVETPEFDPSFLEVYVAMLVRISDNVLTDPGDPSKAPEIFYDMLINLDLLGQDNMHFSPEKTVYVLKKKYPFREKSGGLWYECNKFCVEKWF